LLVLCGGSDTVCALNSATGATVAKLSSVRYNGRQVYGQNIVGWYDDSHFLSWISASPQHYQVLAIVNLSGVVTGALGFDDSVEVPEMWFTRRAAG